MWNKIAAASRYSCSTTANASTGRNGCIFAISGGHLSAEVIGNRRRFYYLISRGAPPFTFTITNHTMATETKQLEIEEHEEDLLELWKEAVNKFQTISEGKFKQSISAGQYERLQDVIQQPDKWSRIFSKTREPGGNLEKLCDRVGEHLGGIEMGIKALGFGFKVAAAV